MVTPATDESNADHLQNRVVAQSLCENDWKFAVNNFFGCKTLKPKRRRISNPFLLYDYQEQVGDEIVKAIENGYDLPVESAVP